MFARKDQAGKPLIGFGDPGVRSGRTSAGLGGRSAAKASPGRSARRAPIREFWRGAGDRPREPVEEPAVAARDRRRAEGGGAKLGAPASDIYLGKEATEATVKRAPLSDYRVVYFATHGLVRATSRAWASPRWR